MTSTMTDITESQFDEYDSDCRLFEHDNPRRFGRYDVAGENSFVFSWRSDTISPSICVSKTGGVTYIGADERLAAVDSAGHVVFSIPLPTLLFSIQNARDLTIAICEQQAIVFNADGSTKATFEFPDIAEDFSVGDNQLSVSFMSGGSEHYEF